MRFHPEAWELQAAGVNLSTHRPDSLPPERYDSEADARRAFARMRRESSGFRYTAAMILPPVSLGLEPIVLLKP